MWLSHALAEQHTPEAMQELRILATTGFIGDPAPTVGNAIGPWMTFIQTLVDQGTSEALQELRDLAQQISAEAEERLARSESRARVVANSTTRPTSSTWPPASHRLCAWEPDPALRTPWSAPSLADSTVR